MPVTTSVRIFGVGVGPGDPELITLKALRCIRACDALVIPQSGSKSVVKSILAPYDISAVWYEVAMPMTRDQKILKESHDKACSFMQELLKHHKKIAFLTLGDPSFYSTWIPLQKRLKDLCIATETIPGVISPCALAARCSVPLAYGTQSFHVYIGKAPQECDGNPFVVMKCSAHLQELCEEFKDLSAYVGKNVGMDQEEVYAAAHYSNAQESSYFTCFLCEGRNNS